VLACGRIVQGGGRTNGRLPIEKELVPALGD
jgi:hypothetical protein